MSDVLGCQATSNSERAADGRIQAQRYQSPLSHDAWVLQRG